MLLILLARDIFFKLSREQTCLNIEHDTKCHERLKLRVLQLTEEDAKGRRLFCRTRGENVPT